MAPSTKRRRTGEDQPYISRNSNRYDDGDGILGWRQRTALQAQNTVPPSGPAKVLTMDQFPAATVHKYLLRYNLLPNHPRPILTYAHAAEPIPPMSLAYLNPRKRTYPDAWYETENSKSVAGSTGEAKGKEAAAKTTEKSEGRLNPPQCQELREPAYDGQEPSEADGRLCDVAANHWDSVSLKEGETIVNFLFAIRTQNKVLKFTPNV